MKNKFRIILAVALIILALSAWFEAVQRRAHAYTNKVDSIDVAKKVEDFADHSELK